MVKRTYFMLTSMYLSARSTIKTLCHGIRGGIRGYSLWASTEPMLRKMSFLGFQGALQISTAVKDDLLVCPSPLGSSSIKKTKYFHGFKDY